VRREQCQAEVVIYGKRTIVRSTKGKQPDDFKAPQTCGKSARGRADCQYGCVSMCLSYLTHRLVKGE
jgi:hypothetical protein